MSLVLLVVPRSSSINLLGSLLVVRSSLLGVANMVLLGCNKACLVDIRGFISPKQQFGSNY